jgi:hypothetical protein
MMTARTRDERQQASGVGGELFVRFARGDARRELLVAPDDADPSAARGADGAFITGSDFLIDGGVTASYFFAVLAP